MTADAIDVDAPSDASSLPYVIAAPATYAAARAANAASRAAAAFAVPDVADNAARATSFAADAAFAGSHADSSAVWHAARLDASSLDASETSRAIFTWPLLQEPINQLEDAWLTVRVAWQSAGPHWQFWIDWYEAALEGRPLLGDWDRHWDLLTEIALIPDADWTAGPDRVNALIAEIVARHRSQRNAHSHEISLAEVQALEAVTEYGEVISRNPDTARLRSFPKSEIDNYHLEDVLDRLDQAVVNFDGQDVPNSPYGIIARDVERLRRVLANRRDRPVRVFQVTLEVVHLIEGRAVSGDCPEIEKDPFLRGFCRELYGSAASLQAHDPVVQAFNNPVLQRRIEEITNEQALQLSQPAASIAAVSEGILAEDLTEDAALLSDATQDATVKRGAIRRTFSRVVRVYGLILRSDAVNTVSLAASIYGLEPILSPWLRWLLGLFP